MLSSGHFFIPGNMTTLPLLISKALTKGRLRIHSTNKTLTRQHIYKILRTNNIKNLRIYDGPNDELWLVRKDNAVQAKNS